MTPKAEYSDILFADAVVETLDPAKTLPFKFKRMLKSLDLDNKVKDKVVGIKMHFGGHTGHTTIHAVFVKILVDQLKESGAKRIYGMDNTPKDGAIRGYLPETLGCDIVSTFGASGKYLYKKEIGFKGLDFAEFGGEAVDCDFFIDLSHVKGHGDCGFGAALKNIAMGVVPPSTRSKIHNLEGGISFNKRRCTYCLNCIKSCPNDAMRKDDEKREISIFHHNCTYCQHCVMICPHGALTMKNRKFEDFSLGMAKITAKFLDMIPKENQLFINFLTNITIYCDCWGMSTPSLVPDIGILASNDITAIETATLDLIKTENFLQSGLPKGRELLDIKGHLFEKVHAKDPYKMIKYLKDEYGGNDQYKLIEVK